MKKRIAMILAWQAATACWAAGKAEVREVRRFEPTRAEKEAGGAPVRRMLFPDAEHGWVFGKDSLWRSGDGGLHWKRMPSHGMRLEPWDPLAAFGDERAWRIGKDGLLSRTRDGGRTWKTFGSLLEEESGQPDALSFVGPELGWGLDGGGRIVRSRDGGESWEAVLDADQSPPLGASDFGLERLCFADGKTGWVLGTYVPEGGEERWFVWGTEDGGASWTVRESGIEAASLRCGTAGGAAWVEGLGKAVLVLAEGGGWERRELPEEGRVRFLDARSGWLLGGKLWRTSDGGRTWSVVLEDAKGASELALAGREAVLLLTPEGTLYRVTWED